jgi:hypothetical protein
MGSHLGNQAITLDYLRKGKLLSGMTFQVYLGGSESVGFWQVSESFVGEECDILLLNIGW